MGTPFYRAFCLLNVCVLEVAGQIVRSTAELTASIANEGVRSRLNGVKLCVKAHRPNCDTSIAESLRLIPQEMELVVGKRISHTLSDEALPLQTRMQLQCVDST